MPPSVHEKRKSIDELKLQGPVSRLEMNERTAKRHRIRKIPRVTAGIYDYIKMTKEVTARSWIVARDCQEHWDEQSTLPSWRTVRVSSIDFPEVRSIGFNHILSGHTMAFAQTEEQLKARDKLKSERRIAQGHGQQHWKEASIMKAFFSWIKEHFSEYFAELYDWDCSYIPAPDGLSADCLIKINGEFIAVQFKSATYLDRSMVYSVKKSDGDPGGRYDGMILVAVAAEFDRCTKQTSHFDHVDSVSIKEIMIFPDASFIPGSVLVPRNKRSDVNDSLDSYRWSSEVDGDNQKTLASLLHHFEHGIDLAKRESQYNFFYTYGIGTPNPSIKNGHGELSIRCIVAIFWILTSFCFVYFAEIINGGILANILGINKLSAPFQQGQITDIILNLDGSKINISLKTAKTNISKECFIVNLGRDVTRPTARHCNIVMAFYQGAQDERTHVSILCARRVYNTKSKYFCWCGSSDVRGRNKDVFRDRIDLSADDVKKQIVDSILDIVN